MTTPQETKGGLGIIRSPLIHHTPKLAMAHMTTMQANEGPTEGEVTERFMPIIISSLPCYTNTNGQKEMYGLKTLGS